MIRMVIVSLGVLAGCAVNGSDVISGKELNRRIQEAVVLKTAICYPGDINNALVATEVNPRYDGGQFYATRDVDRCIEGFNAIPCAAIRNQFGSSSFGLFIGNIYAFVCPGLGDKEFFNPGYLQGNFPDSSSSKSSSSSN